MFSSVCEVPDPCWARVGTTVQALSFREKIGTRREVYIKASLGVMNETFYDLLIRSQSDFQYADSLYFYT